MKDKLKLTKKEKALLQRKLLHGGAYGHFATRVAFNRTERFILDEAERKVDEKHRAKSGGKRK